MRSSCVLRTVGCLFAITLGAASSARATAINVSNPANILSPSNTVVASKPQVAFGGASEVVDNLAASIDEDRAFIFNNDAGTEALSITGFSAPSGFQTVRYFHAPEDPQRVPNSVSVYYSTTSTSSLSPSDYVFLATATAPYANKPFDPADAAGTRRGYFDIPVNAPAGAQSLLLTFGTGANGSRVYEVQALAVPEPASAAAAGLGLGGLLLARRRRTPA